MKISDYITGQFPYPLDDGIIASVLLQRGITDSEMTTYSILGDRNKNLILADIYTIFSNGMYNYSQSIGTADISRKITVSSLSNSAKLYMKRKAQSIYRMYGETENIEQPKSVMNI